MSDLLVRAASAADAARFCAIYNDYVATTTVTFEEEAVAPAEMAQRIADVRAAGLPWLAAERGGLVVGYAYATRWRARPAYRHAVETTIYLAPDAVGQGGGTVLCRALVDVLRAGGLHTAIAGIAQPNARSVALHERLGFRKVAHFEEVGFKLGGWIDVGYWQLMLGDIPPA